MSTTDHTREADILADVLDDHRPRPMPDPDQVECSCDGRVWDRSEWRRHVGAAMVTERDIDMAVEPDSYPPAAHVAAAVEGKDAEIAKWQHATFEREGDKNAAESRARIAEHERDEARAALAAERERAWDEGAKAAGGYGHEDGWTQDLNPLLDNPHRAAHIARSTTDGGE